MKVVVTPRQHMRLAAQMCRERAARHVAAAVNIEQLESTFAVKPVVSGAWAHREAADHWYKASRELDEAISAEDRNGITGTGDGRQL